MKKLFKILFIIIAVIAICIVGVIMCTGAAIKGGLDSMVAPGLQEVQFTNSGAAFTVQLTPVEGLILRDFVLCNDMETPMMHLPYQSSSSSCFKDECVTYITLFDPRPKELTLKRDYEGECHEQTITVDNYFGIYANKAEISITQEIREELGLNKENREIAKTPNSQFSGYTSFTFNDAQKISLDYGNKPPAQDEFTIGGKLIEMKYAMPQATAD